MAKEKTPIQKGKPAAAAPAPVKQIIPAAPPRVVPLFRPIDWFSFAVTTLLVFVGYWLTIAPNLTLEDSGELATGSFYAGIPHPPGYPVWTLYTWLWTVLLPVGNVAWRVGVSQAFAGAVGSGMLAMLVSRGSSMMMEGIEDLKEIPRRWENLICIVSGFVAGMLLGFNGYLWSQSVIVEVYSTSVLSLMGVMLCLMRWTYAPHQSRYLYGALFLYGICFNNHQSLLVIAMGIQALVLAVHRRTAREFFFWNTLIYIGGLLYAQANPSSLINTTMVLFIFNAIGLTSAGVWFWLVFDTKPRWIEFGRTFAVLVTCGLAALWFGIATGFISSRALQDPDDKKVWLGVLGLGVVGAVVGSGFLIREAKRFGNEWLVVILSGVSWVVGCSFYLWMAVSGTTIPPMQWGYPRTVEGFIHAFTRGQYERIHPTTGVGDSNIQAAVNFLQTYGKQLWMYLVGMVDEFNLVYLLIALVVFFYFFKMQKRERAWTIGVFAIFITLGPLLVLLLNPGMDRQSVELNRVFFTASHVMVAMSVGYGVTLITASMCMHYERFKPWCWIGGVIALGLAVFNLVLVAESVFAENTHFTGIRDFFESLSRSFHHDQYALPVFGGLLVVAAVGCFLLGLLLWRKHAPLTLTLAVFAAMPGYSVLTHWAENEQRHHLFGYWFGHDMFTPPFNIYPEMTRDAILYGGTDPGRFCPTYMVFCESQIPARCKADTDPNFDRRDVYVITQNALADGTYLNYIRSHYNRSTQVDAPFFLTLLRGPKEAERNWETNFVAKLGLNLLDAPMLAMGKSVEARRRREGVYPKTEMYIATPDDSQRCFTEYLKDAEERRQKGQLKPGEDVKNVEGRVQVAGQVAVMAINGLIAKVMFERNPTNEFFVEESFPLDWMYPHETPFGIIMKINRNPLPSLSGEILQKDHEFWTKYSERLIGNWVTYDTPVQEIVDFAEKVYLRHDYSGYKGDRKFIRDDNAQKAFSKLRSSIAGVYQWRLSSQALTKEGDFRPKTTAEYDRLMKETDFAFRQAFAFCPYSPEAVFRYVNLLLQQNRFDDALLVAQTCVKLDPNNGQAVDLVARLKEFKASAGQVEEQRNRFRKTEEEFTKNPDNFQAGFNVAMAYLQMQQNARATEILLKILNNPKVDRGAVMVVAQAFMQENDFPHLDLTLERLVKVSPDEPEAWYDLAAMKGTIGKPSEGLPALARALELSAKRRETNSTAMDLMVKVREDARFNPLRVLPEFQKIVPPK